MRRRLWPTAVRNGTFATFEMASAQVSVCLQMTDHGSDGRSAPELAFDGAEDAAFLPRDKDAPQFGRVVAAITLVEIAQPVRCSVASMKFASVCPSYGARQRFGVQHELSAGSANIGGDDGDLDAELIGRAGLAFADHSTSGAWKE
jgi:hypothetical protein